VRRLKRYSGMERASGAERGREVGGEKEQREEEKSHA